MELKPVYIPFQNIFPSLVGSLFTTEEFFKNGGRINPTTPYGQTHKAAVALERRISNLHLIMHRIRLDCGIKILPNDVGQPNFLYIPIDYECFFIWLRTIMDQVAYLTPFFYKTPGVISNNSFNDQLKWFTEKRKDFDREYSKYLAANMSWFYKMRAVRDDTLHRHYWAYAEIMNIGEIKINRMRGNRALEEIASLAKMIGQYYAYFLNFSKYYEDHFSKQMRKKNKDFKLSKQSMTMVRDYHASIDYFIDNA